MNLPVTQYPTFHTPCATEGSTTASCSPTEARVSPPGPSASPPGVLGAWWGDAGALALALARSDAAFVAQISSSTSESFKIVNSTAIEKPFRLAVMCLTSPTPSTTLTPQ